MCGRDGAKAGIGDRSTYVAVGGGLWGHRGPRMICIDCGA
jgi:hypothetical protein